MMRFVLRIPNLLSSRRLVSHTLLLSSGTAFSQGIYVLTSPLLTRLFSPEQFGTFAVYFLVFSLMLAVNSLRYEFAIPLPDDDSDAIALIGLCVVLVLVTTTLFGVFLLSARGWFLSLPGTAAFADSWWLLLVALLVSGLYQPLEYWSARRRGFRRIAAARGGQALTQVTVQVGLGLAGAGALGLVAGHVAGQTALLGAISFRRNLRRFARTLDWRRVRNVAWRYRRYPLFATWTSLLDLLGQQWPTAMLADSLSLGVAGHFSFTMRILGLPSALLGQAVGQVVYPTLAEHKDAPESIRRLMIQAAGILTVLGASVFTFVGLFGTDLYTLVFGEQWSEAGYYAKLLTPWFLTQFIGSPLSTLGLVKERQREVFLFSVLLTMARIFSIWAGAQSGLPAVSVGLFSLVNSVLGLAFLIWLFKLSDIRLADWLHSIRAFLVTLTLIVVAAALARTWMSPILHMALTGVVLALSALGFVIHYTRRSS